ncbi:MAG: hypothetical protein ABH816_00410 [Candidatus Levyibacteriota bacterium]
MIESTSQIKKAILKTISYSDVFDYPLTKDEIWRFLINDSSENLVFHPKGVRLSVRLEMELSNLTHFIVKKDGFYCLRNRGDIVSKRLKKEKESNEKFRLAKKIISRLSYIPTVQVIGISGALSMKNSQKDDDIDLFIIAKKHTLWLTRLLLIIFLKILGKHRGRNDKDIKDKFCLNFLIDEDAILLPKEMQNLYGAHELAQLMPVFNRGNTYQKFVAVNSWVRKFLPNALERGTTQIAARNHAECPVLRFWAFEALAKKIQLRSIKKHRTKEIISDHLLAFHPLDYKDKVLSAYKKRLDRLTRGH